MRPFTGMYRLVSVPGYLPSWVKLASCFIDDHINSAVCLGQLHLKNPELSLQSEQSTTVPSANNENALGTL